jgi:transforming growth factor-beta-induced protein
MRFSTASALALGIAQSVYSQGTQQSLAAAIAPYAELSSFANILNSFPGILSTITDSRTTGVTILIPTNDAFTKFLAQSNVANITQVPVAQLLTVFRYHIMDAKLTTKNFTIPRGLTVPTALRDPLYNNRTAGKQITDLYGADANGQVLFVSKDPIAKPSQFRVRQSLSGENVSLRGGLAQTVGLTSVDGVWDGGFFQVIDT